MGKIAFLFDGQGSQYPGMAKDIFEQIGTVHNLFGVAEAIRPDTLRQMFFGTEEELKRTDNAQPCLFLTDVAAAEALMKHGIQPDVLAGFSLGELAALAVAGILEMPEMFKVVCTRGELMQQAAEKTCGGMLAILGMDREEVLALCNDYEVYPVNYNCPGQIVVSGKAEKIAQMKDKLLQCKTRFAELAVGGPFHTPYMESASDGIKALLQKKVQAINSPALPVYSNLTASPYENDKERIIATISTQLKSPVKWEDTILAMAKDGVDVFIECGPGKALSGFVKRIVKGVRIYNVCDMESLLKVVGELKENVGE